MGNELHHICLVATWRLMLLIGVAFGLIWFVQYIELPYVNVISSVFVTTPSQVASTVPFLSKDSLNLPAASTNMTGHSTDSVGSNVADRVPSSMKASDGMDGDTRNVVGSVRNFSGSLGEGFGQENGMTLNDTLDDDIDPEIELPLKVSLEMDRDSTIETAIRNNLGDSDATSRKHESSQTVDSSVSSRTPKPKRFKGRPGVGVPISEMNDLLKKSRVSYHSMKVRWPSQADRELLKAKKLIESADSVIKKPRVDVNVYRNFSAFARSYELMEQTLKIYIYTEGERPIFHHPELSRIYASEGWFMKQLEESKRFITKNGNKAHLFYLPFSSLILRKTLYVQDSHNRTNMVRYLSSYLQNITTAHPFWNRTNGTDHFLVACHDWAPALTGEIMNNCIRSLCNTNVKKGFQFSKDVSLPVTYIRDASNTLRGLGGKPPPQRHILAFFAGNMHGYLRPILLNHWESKDPEMKISGQLRGGKGEMTYSHYMKRSKYCISAKGYEPFTPRVVEAIFYECVPVILSDNYIPPFFETLDWEAFAVFVLEKDIPNLKRILTSIPEKRYNVMQKRVRQVQKHFLWHVKPVKFDVFHMILHSLWYTRVLQLGA